MAISFVGASPVVTGANPTVDIPSGVQAGDFLMLFVSSNGSSNTPTNWLPNLTQNATTIFTKTATSSESSVSLENSNTTTVAVMLAYRGVGYIDVLAGSGTTGTSTSATTSSALTTRFDNDYVISFYASGSGTANTWTAPASTTTRINQSSSTTVRGMLIVDELQATAGAVTTRTATLAASTLWNAWSVSLKEPQAFYIDPENGNDANNGRTFGTALKNISGATSAKGITAGDTVRLKQSPIYNTGVNATWTSVQDRGVSPFNTFSIISTTNATPIVCTTSIAHGYSTGDVVQITGVSGNTAANGIWKVTVTGLLTFSLDDSVGNGPHGGGGVVSPIFCRTIKTATALVKPIASFAPLSTVSLGTRAAWVGSTNVTTSLTTTFGKGAVLDIISTNTSFTTGKIAYYTLPSTLDLSSYQQLSLFIQQFSGSTLGGLTISLCSDTTGDTAVDTFTIPSTGTIGTWCPFTINKGSALGSSIRSISISRAANNGAQTFYFNSIVAVKSPTSVDALSNTSLVTKNNGTEGAYSVGGFGGSDGTIVFLDTSPTSTNQTTGSGAYYGTSETVTLHRIEPFNPFTLNSVALPSSASAANSYCAYPNNSGQLDNHITYSGGWDATNMSTRTGQTWFTNSNGFGAGLNHVSPIGYLTIDRCNYTRSNNGVSLGTPITTRTIYQNCNYTAIQNAGLNFNNICAPLEIQNCIVTNTNSSGISIFLGSGIVSSPSIINNSTFSGNTSANLSGFSSTGGPFLNITNSTFNTSTNNGINLSGQPMFGDIINCSINYFNTTALISTGPIIGTIDTVTLVPEPNGGGPLITVTNGSAFSQVPQNVFTTFRNVTVVGPATQFSAGTTSISYVISGGSNCKFYNCSFEATNVTYTNNIQIRDGGSTYLYSCTGFSGTQNFISNIYAPWLLNNAAYSQDEGGTIGNNKIYFCGGLATSQTAVRKTPSGYAWSIAPISTATVTAAFPIKLKIASIAANGSSPVTISTWMRRTNTGLTMQLVCPAGQPYGPTSDVVSSITAVADTWQEVSITFTPTQNAVFDIYVYAFGGTTFTGYVDDLTVSQ